MVVAFLDANIFPHTWLTDVLLTFADHHLFDPEYSDDVLEEARRAFVDDLGKDPAWGSTAICPPSAISSRIILSLPFRN